MFTCRQLQMLSILLSEPGAHWSARLGHQWAPGHTCLCHPSTAWVGSIIKHRFSWLYSKHVTIELFPQTFYPVICFFLRHTHRSPFFLFFFFVFKSFWRQSLSLAWISSSGLGCLTSESQGCICLSPEYLHAYGSTSGPYGARHFPKLSSQTPPPHTNSNSNFRHLSFAFPVYSLFTVIIASWNSTFVYLFHQLYWEFHQGWNCVSLAPKRVAGVSVLAQYFNERLFLIQAS